MGKWEGYRWVHEAQTVGKKGIHGGVCRRPALGLSIQRAKTIAGTHAPGSRAGADCVLVGQPGMTLGEGRGRSSDDTPCGQARGVV